MSVPTCSAQGSRPPSGVRRALLCLALAAVVPAARANTDLTALSLEQLMDLRVVGASKYEQKQSEVAAAVSVITRDEIRAFGWRTLDEALASLPGVHTTYDRQYKYLGMRGFGLPGDYNTRVLLTINGNRSNDVVFDAALLGREFPLDLGLIERIEFIPGPGGAVYGQNAMFGVINIVTRDGADMGGLELALAAQGPQATGEGRVSWGRRFESGAQMLLSISGERSRGEDRYYDFGSTGIAGLARRQDGESDHELFASVAAGAWSFDFVLSDRRKDDPTASFGTDPLVAGQYQRDRNLHTQLQYQKSFDDGRLQLSARAFLGEQRYTGLFSYGTPFLSTGSSSWRGTEWRGLSTHWSGHKLLLGIEAQANTRTDQGFDDLVQPANNLAIPGTSRRTGLFVQDEIRIADGLASTLGLRLDQNSLTGTHASPRAALIWQANGATTLKALYGRAHRAPNASERDFDDGVFQVSNPMLKGERIDTIELVADRRVDPDLALRASLYRWDMRGLITLGIDPVTGLTQYQSGQNGNASGAEFSALKTWPGGARLRASVSLQHVAFAGGVALPNSPHLLAKLNAVAPLPWAGMRLGYEWQFDAGRRSLDGAQLGGYALSGLHLGIDAWAPGLELGLGIRNLFDKVYAQPAASRNWQETQAQDGRSVRVQARLRF